MGSFADGAPAAGASLSAASCTITGRRQLTGQTAVFRLDAPRLAAEARPGQFVHVQVPSGPGADPFLRRPFSLAGIWPDSGQVELVIEAVRRGTAALLRSQEGDEWDVLGPLGRAFPLPQGGKSLLVGGGTGSAPLLALASAMAAGQTACVAQTRFLMLCGARTASELWALKLAAERGLSVLYSTDDGTAGHPGLVTDLLAAELHSGQIAAVYACGPLAMLQAIGRITAAYSVPYYLSLEQRLACGVGACRGCSWPRADGSGYVRICRDGPVFRAEEVAL
jgi:dihydroorotate dehydrogenase electron transfer subunit